MLSHYLSPNDATQWWLSLWPTDESCICSITTRVVTFLEKSQMAHSLAFNTTDSLFNSPACEAAYCFSQSLQVLWENAYYARTNKEKIDDYRRWNLKLKLKWGPKTHLQLPLIAIGIDNEMKISEIITLTKNLFSNDL